MLRLACWSKAPCNVSYLPGLAPTPSTSSRPDQRTARAYAGINTRETRPIQCFNFSLCEDRDQGSQCRAHPGVVVEGVRGEGIVHQGIAAAGAAAKDDLNGARDGVLGVSQQGPLQFRHHLLRTCHCSGLHPLRKLQILRDGQLVAATTHPVFPLQGRLWLSLRQAFANKFTHVAGKGVWYDTIEEWDCKVLV